MAASQKERTLVIIKPDGVQRSLVGEIVRRIERTGLKFVGFRFLVPTEEQCWAHYNKDEAWFLKTGTRIAGNLEAKGLPVNKSAIEYGKDVILGLVKFMTSGPVLAMVIEGNQSVAVVKKLVGSTEPATSDVGTIRGDMTIDSYEMATLDSRAVRNLVHCTDAPEEATREIKLWFDEKDIINYRLVGEQVLYDVNLDGILE